MSLYFHVCRHRSPYLVLFTLILLVSNTGCISTIAPPPEISETALAEERNLQQTLAFKAYLDDQKRVMNIGFKLRQGALGLIELDNRSKQNSKPAIGLYTANKYSFKKSFREVAEKQFAIGEEIKILSVAPDSPAERSGLKAGDVLIAVNNEKAPTGENAPDQLEAFWDRHLEGRSGAPITLTLNRDGVNVVTTIAPEFIVKWPLVLNNAEDVNAHADGHKVVINRGLLRFLESDTELAYVISHEIAHNLMKHPRSVIINYVLGTLVDVGLAFSGIFLPNPVGTWAAYSKSQKFEIESDYISLFILHRSGYDLDEVTEFWRRLATIRPGIIEDNWLSTHPSSPERLLAMEAVIKEIKKRIENEGQILPAIR